MRVIEQLSGFSYITLHGELEMSYTFIGTLYFDKPVHFTDEPTQVALCLVLCGKFQKQGCEGIEWHVTDVKHLCRGDRYGVAFELLSPNEEEFYTVRRAAEVKVLPLIEGMEGA